MVDPFSIAVLGATAAKAGFSYIKGISAADQRRRETAEAVRRLKLQQAQVVGATEAAGAGSGVEVGSKSLTSYLTQMTAEFDREADWMRKAGNRGADAADTAAGFGLLGDLGGGIFKFGAANNWFKG